MCNLLEVPPLAVPVAMLASSLGFDFAVGFGDGFAREGAVPLPLPPLNIEALTPSSPLA